jgi:O-methyltransferase involved in polyketide biosynthesis
MFKTIIIVSSLVASGAHAQTTGPGASGAGDPEQTIAAVPSSVPVAARTIGDVPIEPSAGTAAIFKNLEAHGSITELRSSTSGDYRADLSFFKEGLTYYVVLAQNNTYWRVIATASKPRAEAVYAKFVALTVRLSSEQRRQIELEATNAATERSMSQAQQQIQRLQADSDIAKAQQDEVTTRLEEVADQVKALESQNQDAQNQLIQAKRQVAALQAVVDSDIPGKRLARHGKKRSALAVKSAARTHTMLGRVPSAS